MLTAERSLRLNLRSAPELPFIPELSDLHAFPSRPRHGELIMVAGRPATGKSTFGLWYASKLAENGISVLYFSADMTPYEASVRLACSKLHKTTDQISEMLYGGKDAEIHEGLKDCNVTFSFGEITWSKIEREIDTYVELWNEYPGLIVIDNLMDIEGCESDYAAQKQAMQFLTNINREIGSTMIVLHHCSDKTESAKDPSQPPGRRDIMNGLGEKPQRVWTVAINPHSDEFRIAQVKARMDRCDPSGHQYATIRAVPEEARYERHYNGVSFLR